MNSWTRSLLCLAAALCVAPALHAQALPTASRSTHIQAGGGLLYLRNDYTDDPNYGVFFYGDYDFSRYVGVEAEVNLGGIVSKDDIGETTYLVGPRATYHYHKALIFAKIMVGRGTITNQAFGANNASSSYNVFAFGGGVDYRVYRFINARAQVELQKWPDFEPHTLSPVQASIGVAYVFH